MGIYYKISCADLRENIDPGSINDLGIKASATRAIDEGKQ